MFIEPGTDVYEGMIIGEHSRGQRSRGQPAQGQAADQHPHHVQGRGGAVDAAALMSLEHGDRLHPGRRAVRGHAQGGAAAQALARSQRAQARESSARGQLAGAMPSRLAGVLDAYRDRRMLIVWRWLLERAAAGADRHHPGLLAVHGRRAEDRDRPVPSDRLAICSNSCGRRSSTTGSRPGSAAARATARLGHHHPARLIASLLASAAAIRAARRWRSPASPCWSRSSRPARTSSSTPTGSRFSIARSSRPARRSRNMAIGSAC